MSFTIRACGLTDVGKARAHNEDCFGIDADNRLVVVADGMGGHSHGEVASRIAVQSIRDYVDRRLHEISALTSDLTSENGNLAEHDDHGRLLATALRRAHQQVLGAIQRDGSLYGMGTTVVGLLLRGGVAAVAHVGDSRAYRVRGGRLELLTQDHTWVNEQVVAGYLSAEQARVHPLKNVVTRALGGDSEVLVDVREVEVAEGDLFLLCSDGLTTMMSDPDISLAFTGADGLEETCRQLVSTANSRGGLDNVTVVLVAIERDDETQPSLAP